MGRNPRKKRNGKSKKQPKVGRMAFREHANRYPEGSRFPHNAYGVAENTSTAMPMKPRI